MLQIKVAPRIFDKFVLDREILSRTFLLHKKVLRTSYYYSCALVSAEIMDELKGIS